MLGLNLKREEIAIFSFFILLTLIITWPLIIKIGHSIFSDPEWTFDSLGSIYGIWWAKYAWLNKIPVTFNHLVAFPFGVDTSPAPSQPCFSFPLLLLSLCQNEFFAYNFFILSSFVLSAVIMYYLMFYLTKNKLTSMVSGIIFAFCPNHSLQSFSHLGLAVIQWIPLYVLVLLKLNEKKDYQNALFWAIGFSLVVVMNYYYGYFMLIFTAGFVLFKVCYNWRSRRAKTEELVSCFKNFKVIMLAGILALLIILPFTYSTIKTALLPAKPVNVVSGYVRSYNDVFRYAGRLYDYALPSEYHPVFGKFTKKIVKKITGGQRHWSDRTLYLGYTPLFLAILSIVAWWKRRKKSINSRENFYIPLFTFLMFFMVYCSLSPVVTIWKFKIPTPSFFLYHLAPMFRYYSRMGFVVTLCVAVLAGFGLRDILTGVKRRWKQTAIALGFSSLILFEYTVIPPFRNVDFSKTPAVYEWLAKQPEDVAIVEYPLYNSINEKHYEYLFWQRIHQKRMVNGAPDGTLAEAMRLTLRDITNPENHSLLSYLGAKYVIIHKNRYGSEEMQAIDDALGLTFFKDFPIARVYAVTAQPLALMQVFRDFGGLETWSDGSKWHWTSNNAQIWLCNTLDNKMFINLKFRVLSFARGRTLELFLNDSLLREIEVPAVSSLNLARQVCLENIEIPPGENIFRFYTPEGPERIDDVAHSGDMRQVSLAFGGIKVEVVEEF